MLFDPTIDSEETILKLRLAILNSDFVENGGATTVSWTSEGTAETRTFPVDVKTLLIETKNFLKQVNGTRVTRTRPFYTL